MRLTIKQIMMANSQAGENWFGARQKELLGTIVSSRVHVCPRGEVLFVASSFTAGISPNWIRVRRYSIFHFRPNGTITNVGRVHAYSNLKKAHFEAAKIAAKGRRLAGTIVGM